MVPRIARSMTVAALLLAAAACASGATPEQAVVAVPSPSASISAQDIAWDRSAQSSLRNSLAAALTHYTDAASYEGLTPETIAFIEPSFTYVEAEQPSTDDATLSVAVVRQGEVYAAAALSGSGRCFTIRDDRERTTHGVIEDGSACTGAAALDSADRTWD